MKPVLPLLLLTLTAAASAGARRIADFFVEAPMYQAAPNIDRNTRMDMLDYFRSGLPSKTTNIVGEPVAVLSENDRSIRVCAGDSVTLEYGLAVSGPDSLLIVIENLPTPMPDSKVSFFSTDWTAARPLAVLSPALNDWLTDEGRSNRSRAEEILPFITASARFDQDGNRLIFTPTIGRYFATKDSIASEVERYIVPSLTYVYNGKTFVSAR